MSLSEKAKQQRITQEVEQCARAIFLELTGGTPRPEFWYRWYLCERHGGPPLLDRRMPPGQIAYWDGEDIVLDLWASDADLIAALPEELTHRLCSRITPRFEPLNYTLCHALGLSWTDFQERVGQRVASLFADSGEAGC